MCSAIHFERKTCIRTALVGLETLITTCDLGRISLTDRAWIYIFQTMGRVWGALCKWNTHTETLCLLMSSDKAQNEPDLWSVRQYIHNKYDSEEMQTPYSKSRIGTP